jgi:type VII secretion integral membrane protein EccD
VTVFTRLTVLGSARKAELVVPNDESVGTLLVRIAELLEEPTGSLARPLTLTRTTGEQLDLSESLASQAVRDGELIRLIRVDEAPPPPEVSDVTDVVAEVRESHAGLWNIGHRRIVSATAIGVGTALLGFLLLTSAGSATPALLLGGFAVLLVGSVATGLGRLQWAATAFLAAALGGVLPASAALLDLLSVPAASSGAVLLLLASSLGWLAVGAGFGIALRARPALWSSLIGVGISVLPLALLATGLPLDRVAAVTGVVAVFGIGFLPWFAMSASGLTGLDDQVIEGRFARRTHVTRTLEQAYSTLTWTTVALAVPVTASIVVLLSSSDPWTLWLGLALLLVTALRTRAFPLASQSTILWAAAALALVAGLAAQTVLSGAATLVLITVLIVLLALIGAFAPPAHLRARFRKLGDVVEVVSAVSLIPLVLGAFGIYADLLGTFTK